MYLTTSEPAEVPKGFTKEQLDALAQNVEVRRQQLEHGIEEYISSRQAELRRYEQDVSSMHATFLYDDDLTICKCSC